MNPANDFILPDFEAPMDTSPSPMTYEQILAEFDEIISALRLRETPRALEDVSEFRMQDTGGITGDFPRVSAVSSGL